MLRRILFSLILGVLIAMTIFSCTTVVHDRNVQQRKEDVLRDKENYQKYIYRILANLRDAPAIRELGIICVKFGKYDKGRLFLKRANALNSEDTRAKFYLGLAMEFSDQEQEAINIYRNYADLSSFSPYHRLMKGRYQWLLQKQARNEILSLLQQEQQLGLDSLSLDALGIFPLRYAGTNSEYSSLGRGLCEMMITDLSQVQELKIVERVRINSLLEEMAMGQSGLIDGETAPKCGKLLRAHRIISGNYDLVGKSQVKMDVNFWDFPNREPSVTQSKENPLRDILKMEKQIVLDLIADLGIYLTHQDREKILKVPTKNIQAFIAYCKGLEKQDAGNFDGAIRDFQKAVLMDPGFEAATEKLHLAEALRDVAVEKEALLTSMERIEKPFPFDLATENLVNRRLRTTANNIGNHFVPGQDNREAPEEATTAGMSSEFGELPQPPPAPHGQ